MLEIVNKYIIFDMVENQWVNAKIKTCKTIDELLKVFKEAKCVITKSIIESIANDLAKLKRA